MHRKTIRPTLRNAALVAALGPVAAAAQDTAAPRVIEIEQIVVTGTPPRLGRWFASPPSSPPAARPST